MDKKNIVKYILAYVIISLIIHYFFGKKTVEKNDTGTIVRIENNKIISNKPVNIDMTLLENPIKKEFLLDEEYNQKNYETVALEINGNTYLFSTYTGAPILYKYLHPITKKELIAYNFCNNENERLPALSMIINNNVITNFNIDSSNEDKNSVIFYKQYNGCTIIRKYHLNNDIIQCEIEIDNPHNRNIGSIQIINQEQILLNKDQSEGAFSYNEDDKIVKFLYQNELVLNQSIILNPEIVGVQSNFFTQAIIPNDNSFDRAFFKKNNLNEISYFLESKVIKNNHSKLSFNWYIGPKIYSKLNSIDSRLALIMEYGILSKISQLFMHFIFLLTYLFNNFGISLLIFTALTKLILIPFASSIKENNKKSKEFQQKLEYIKAKYHNDPDKKLIEETSLFKKYGMFPGFASKIPQIFNLFIVLALQSSLKKNIMLYQVPVGFWLTDATMPDKYYILTIIFIIFMYLNINKAKMVPMMKIAILMIFMLFIYMFSFWASGVQLFIVAGVIAGYLETTYLLI
jgi:membrane protein insertase Oxa1/YidC/SpoIIIJ